MVARDATRKVSVTTGRATWRKRCGRQPTCIVTVPRMATAKRPIPASAIVHIGRKAWKPRSASVPSLSWSNRRLGVKAAGAREPVERDREDRRQAHPDEEGRDRGEDDDREGETRRPTRVAAATEVGAEQRADRERDQGRRDQQGEGPRKRSRDRALRTGVDDALDIELEQVGHRKPVRGGVRNSTPRRGS